jgi:hypothetical protein
VTRFGIPVSWFVAGVAVALLAIYIALRFAPDTIMADDMVDASSVAAAAALSQFTPGSTVYIKTDIGPALLEKLTPRYPSLRLLSYSLRPEDGGCTSAQTVLCKRNNFLKLEVLTAPTHRTMLVAFGTSNAFGQVLLFKLWGHWRIVVASYHVV